MRASSTTASVLRRTLAANSWAAFSSAVGEFGYASDSFENVPDTGLATTEQSVRKECFRKFNPCAVDGLREEGGTFKNPEVSLTSVTTARMTVVVNRVLMPARRTTVMLSLKRDGSEGPGV
eukprot:1369182-Rhodomonas_salina.1